MTIASSTEIKTRRFIALGVVTIMAVYLLILVGGTVRATGSGMGCPDWPTCFGQLVPPTDESQLPANWREIYADRGYDVAPFEPIKTWIEYINRLVGVSIGLLIIAFTVMSARFRKIDPVVFWCAVGALVMVSFNGWLGSKVVASNLRPVMISLHMAGAFFVQMFLIYATVRASRLSISRLASQGLPSWFQPLVLATMVAMVFQIYMGVQIRESVDLISRISIESRAEWIELVPWIFYVHRSFSWVILALALLLIYKLWRSSLRLTIAGRAAKWLVAFIVFEMLLGAMLNHLGFPAVAQPMHLLAAHLIFGLLWLMWSVISVSRLPEPTAAPGGDKRSTQTPSYSSR